MIFRQLLVNRSVPCYLQLMSERPDVAYNDIGGMDIQKQEIKEAVELPLTHFELYKQIGIDPPRGNQPPMSTLLKYSFLSLKLDYPVY